MTELATFFAGRGGHYTLAFLVISGFLISIVMFYWQTHRITLQVRRGLRLLHDIGKLSSSDPVGRKMVFSQHWNRFREVMESGEMDLFASSWYEFKKHLILPTADAPRPIRTTVEPTLYFNERGIYFLNINSRLYDAVPGFLTGGGIFGTFVGLVAGISLAQSGMTAGPQEMRQAMQFLMGGVSTAFITSVFGIGFSIVFSVQEKRRQYAIGRMINQFSEELELCLEMATPENTALSKLHVAQMEQIAELQKIGQLLKTAQGMPSAGSTAPRELETRIGAGLAPAMGKMFETLVKYQDNQKSAQKDALRDALAPVLDRLQETLTQKMSGMELAIHALVEHLRKGQEAPETGTHDLQNRMDALSANLATLLRGSSEGAAERLDRAINTVVDVMRDLQAQQKAQHEEALRHHAQLQTTSRETVDHTLDRFASSLDTRMDQQGAQLTTTLRDIADALRLFQPRAETTDGERQEFLLPLSRAMNDLAEVMIGMRAAQNDLAAQLRDSSAGLAGRSERSLVEMAGMVKTLQTAISEMSNQMRDSSAGLAGRSERIMGELAGAVRNMQSVFQEMTTQLHDSSNGLVGRSEHSMSEMTRVAMNMQTALQEMAALVRDSSMGISGRQERALADLAAVASGMRNAQTELAALLRDSSAGFAGSLARTITDLTSVADSMKTAQGEMVSLLRESSVGFSERLNRTITDLSQTSTTMMAVQQEMQRFFSSAPHLLMATEKLLQGMERFQGSIGDRMAALDQTRVSTQGIETGQEEMIRSLGQFMAQSRESMQQDSLQLNEAMVKAGRLFLGATEKLEATMTNLSSLFANSLNQFSRGATEVTAGMHHANDQLFARIGDSLLSLNLAVDGIRSSQEEMRDHFLASTSEVTTGVNQANELLVSRIGDVLRAINLAVEGIRSTREEMRSVQVIPPPETRMPSQGEEMQNRFEMLIGALSNLFERMEANTNSTMHTIQAQHHASASYFQQSQQHMTEGNMELQEVLQASGLSFRQSAAEMGQAAAHMAHALQTSIRWSEENRQAMDAVIQFSNSFGQAQNRFAQMIQALESGAMMIAVAGERLQGSTDKMESVARELSATQETARQTLNAILKAHEQLRVIWHNYESRFTQVDTSLEQTFNHLNDGLQEFANRVLRFIAGVDDQMGGITEKLGYVIGDFGSKLEDLNDTMSGFLDKMSGTIIQPMHDASGQILQAGEKIHGSLSSLSGLASTLSLAHGEARDESAQTLSNITETHERMKTTISLMQRQMDATLNEHQQRLEQVNVSMQQTMAHINSDLSEFSSEKILEFIGGVDEHMESVSIQLRDTISDLNGKLDELNNMMVFVVQTQSNQE
ncbi:MAG: hypothetical protein HQL96_11025 [Magnetococcales bacterium]|nr:hypothetical protein [Magnetococcales bacterium]